MSRLRGPICTYCGSSETFAFDAHPEWWSCRTCDSDIRRSIDNLHWGKQYVLGHGGNGWAIWRQRPFENPDGSGMTVDKFDVIASYPYGQTGWHEAWDKFIELEPRYPLRRRWDRMKPRIGVAVFWGIALGLLVTAVAAEGLVALVLSVGLGLYLLLFLVMALGESLPWNE